MVKMNLLALTNKWDNNFCICPDSNQGSNVDIYNVICANFFSKVK